MKKTKSIKTAQHAKTTQAQLQTEDKSEQNGIVQPNVVPDDQEDDNKSSNATQTGEQQQQQPLDTVDSGENITESSSTNTTLNVSTTSSIIKQSPPKRDPSKPSSNFTPIERTFILMAIAAVRADPKWRKHDNPESVEDFTVPFCNAVRQKLREDPDFKGKVAVASATPERAGKVQQSPSKESIRKIWINLYLRGSITRDYTNMGRKKDVAAEERVRKYLQQNPDAKISSRAIAAQTNTSNKNVIRILKQEKLAVRKTKFKKLNEKKNTKKD